MKLDFHSHILPGIDDGASNMNDAVTLASAMKSWGFERVTCTPHITALYRNTPDIIRPVFENLKEELYKNNIDLDIKLSAEYSLVPETWPAVLKNNWLMPIEDRFILMELPISKRQEMGDVSPLEEFKKIVSLGLTPILPHPERYFYLSEDELCSFIDAGVKIQSNYGSFAGLYGEKAKKLAEYYQEKGYITYYGTDMHNMHYVEVMGKWFSEGNQIAEF